ncbi:MAG: sugar phosphate isomerase/epimerase [Maribacter sp.]|nr:sugar phosphate isomerase/epimerase [Maribacter sp.]
MKKYTRRDFLKNTSLSALAVPLLSTGNPIWSGNQTNLKLPIHIFSKHLQFLDYRAAGEVAANLGFAGIDLTVRPNGHVAPERVKEELPRAIEDIKKGGSNCVLMTTAVENAKNELDRAVLTAAALEGITHYRANWFDYRPGVLMQDSVHHYAKEVEDLSHLNRTIGIIGCYQNHAGLKIGASLWEVAQLLETADPVYFGVQYDIRHATVEGGLSWENGLRLIKHQMKTLVLKDFKWELVGGKWTIVNTPIGEGMVDFHNYFKILKEYQINVPVILHMEYALGGAEAGARVLTLPKEDVFRAMRKDLHAIQELWESA